MERKILKDLDPDENRETPQFSVKNIIKSFNDKIEANNKLSLSVAAINDSLKRNSPADTLRALKSLREKLPAILDDAAPLYHEEMAAIIGYNKEDLSLDAIYDGVKLLTAIAEINAAIDTKQSLLIWKYLSTECAHIQRLVKPNMLSYATMLCERSAIKKAEGDLCHFLTYPDIQIIIDEVNETMSNDAEMISTILDVNSSLNSMNISELSSILQNPNLNLTNFSAEDAPIYLTQLQKLRLRRATERNDSGAELWLDDIECAYANIELLKKEAKDTFVFLKKLNRQLAINDRSKVCSSLGSRTLDKLHIRNDLIPRLVEELFNFFKAKKLKEHSPYLHHTLSDGTKISLDFERSEFFWGERENVCESKYIGFHDIQTATANIEHHLTSYNKLQESVIGLQAACRGWLVRRDLKKRHVAAFRIQQWWRMLGMRRNYLMYREALRIWEPQIIKIQRAVRKWLLNRKLTTLTKQLKDKEYLIIRIQRAWRRYKARQNLNSLMQLKNPPICVIRSFIHLLEVSSIDFNEEIRLQGFKTDIVKNIRRSQTLETQIDELDVKIGLLVQNIINIEDVFVTEKENVNPAISKETDSKKFKKVHKSSDKFATFSTQRGLKALRKESRERLIGYQHLFYLLQTESHYLSTLIFSVPPGKTTHFLENVIFSLYNYGANDRDNYLLLKLFKYALEKETRNNVMRLSDVVSGNPMVIKMAFSLIRRGPGNSSLKELLSDLVNKVISDTSLQVNTNPVEIYKNWINQMESQTGQPSGLPYKITPEAAVKYPEVEKRMLKAIRILKEVTTAFCLRIVSNRHLIPYSMQYIAKVLKTCLESRFPHIPEKEILKTIGHLIYYRYINSAIVSPDAFGIINLPPEKKLTISQRSNLASIAKVLQLASTKKGFGEESGCLVGLNPFIVGCHEKLKLFFKECCTVPEPEDFYNVHQYTEATLIIKPTVHLSLQEIVETHRLLLDHQDELAPAKTDPLHGLLADLDQDPTVWGIIGETRESAVGVERTEVCLALSAKVDPADSKEEKSDKRNSAKLFLKAEQLLVDLLQCADFEDIQEMASGATTADQEAKYRDIVDYRSQQEIKAEQNETGLNRTNSFLAEARVSLHEVKTKLLHSLRRLENQGLSTRSDNYQTLLNAIAKDIITQRIHRKTRREEIQKLFRTNNQLEAKVAFYNEQLDSYKTYLQTCLRNITTRNKNVHEAEKKKKKGVKYTGAKLHEKGVLLEVKDLPAQQLRNVLFEFVPLASSGVFEVRVKFMGVAMETMQIDVQDLLQLQYEGVAVKQLLGKALINVNLLLHVLNTKFYSKKK